MKLLKPLIQTKAKEWLWHESITQSSEMQPELLDSSALISKCSQIVLLDNFTWCMTHQKRSELQYNTCELQHTGLEEHEESLWPVRELASRAAIWKGRKWKEESAEDHLPLLLSHHLCVEHPKASRGSVCMSVCISYDSACLWCNLFCLLLVHKEFK